MTNLPTSKIQPLHEVRFDGTKLQFARERLNISGKQLADTLHTSPSFITACEKGRKRPSADLELLLAHELRVTPQFFYGPPHGKWELADCHFRHRQAATKSEMSQVRSQLYFYSRLLTALTQIVRLPGLNLPVVTSQDQRSVEEVAAETRRLWKISPSSPIDLLCRLVENAGIVIVFHSGDAERVDAGSHFGQTPLIVVTRKNRGTTRLNSDVGHELAELIYHEMAESTAAYEKKMNQYVGALLLPESGFAAHFKLRPLTLSHLWELKRTWHVSLSAILQRALQLGLLSEVPFVQWKRKFNSRGWSKTEPNEPAFVGPEVLKKSLAVVMRKGVQLRDLADHVGLSEHGLAELLHANGCADMMTGVVRDPEPPRVHPTNNPYPEGEFLKLLP